VDLQPLADDKAGTYRWTGPDQLVLDSKQPLGCAPAPDFGSSRRACPRRILTAHITLTLPDEQARQARSAGLLNDEAIAALLREAMKKHQVDPLFVTLDKLAALEPTLSEEEIDAEIAAATPGGVLRAPRAGRNPAA
jgi:hypothetical protein